MGEVPVAYVQLKQPLDDAERLLIAHAATTITERAAVPKRIVVVDALPMTALGKVFKPALVSLEIDAVVRSTAEALGLTGSLQVQTRLTSDRGQVAAITLMPSSTPVKERLVQELASFASAVDITEVAG